MSHRSEDGAPSERPRYALRVLRLQPDQHCEVLMLSEELKGLWCHWIRGRGGVYCPPDGTCPKTIHAEPIVYRGYVAGELWAGDPRLWFPTVVEITSSCELDLRGRYQRGQLWELHKSVSVKGKRGDVSARYLRTLSANAVRPAFDILPVLAGTYNYPDIRLTRDNPMPGRVFVRPHEGDEPRPAANADSEESMEAIKTFKRLFAERPELRTNGRAKS